MPNTAVLAFTATSVTAMQRMAIVLCASLALMIAGTFTGAIPASAASAQSVETFDPDDIFGSDQTAPNQSNAVGAGIDADLAGPDTNQDIGPAPTYTAPQPVPAQAATVTQGTTEPGFDGVFDPYSDYGAASSAPSSGQSPDIAAGDTSPAIPADAAENSGTYGEDDLIGAAEGVFGKGAEGLARMIQDLLKDQGQPNGYIVGREAGGAFVFGARYGSGTLHHKIEGTRKVYWTGPSVGFDAGANAANTFILVYNLYDTQELFKRYAAGEGQAYLIGGLHASYVRRGDKVLIPIRMGVGARLGINAGYLKFSEKQRWLPF